MSSENPGWRLSPSAVLFACLFAAQAAILVVSPILPDVAREFGVSTSAAAQLRSVTGLTAGVFALVIAAKGARFSLMSLLRLGLGLLALGALASALSPNLPTLLVSQLPLGLGLAMVLSGGLAASDVWADDGESAKVLSWALVGQPVAWIAGQPVVGVVADADWRWAWIAVPFAAALLALVATGLSRRRSESSLECDPVDLWRRPRARRWAVGELAAFSAWAGTLVFAGAFFIDTYGVGVGATGLILGLVAAAYLPGNFLGRRLLTRGSPSRLLLGTALALALGSVAFAGTRLGPVWSVAFLALLAFFAGGRTIAGAAFGLEIAENLRLASMSIRTSMLQFGYLLGTMVGGIVLSFWGYGGVWLVFAAMFTVAGLLHLPGSFPGTVSPRGSELPSANP
jgi:DHA1 family inner membrane transport protein